MALTKVAPAGIGSTPGDGYRIGLSFLHSTGVELTNANASGIVTAAQFDGKLNIGIATFTEDVKFTGASGNILFDKSQNRLEFDDSVAATFGTAANLRIYGTSSNGQINNYTGDLFIQNDSSSTTEAIKIRGKAGEDSIVATADGSVASYYNNVKRLETSGIGATVTGQLDVGNVSSTGVITATKFVGDIAVGSSITYADNEKAYFGTDLDGSIKHTGTNFQIFETTGGLQITNYANDQDVDIRSDDGSGGTSLYFRADGSTGEAILYNYGSEKLKTTSSGASVTGDLTLTDTTADSAAGPELLLYRNSSSPADADYLGQIKFQGENDNDEQINYAKITGKISDASDSSEDGILEFAHIKAGSQTITGRWKSTELQLLNDTDFSVAGESTFTGAIDADGGADISGGSGLVASTAKVSDLTSGRVVIAGTSGELEDASTLTFSGGTLSATTFSGSGASLTTLNGSNISSGTVAAARVATLNQDTTGTAATIAANGNLTCGIITATNLVGNGSGLTNISGIPSESDTAVSSTSATTVATIDKTAQRAAFVDVVITQSSAYQAGRYGLIHDGTTATIVEEFAIATGSMLGTFSATISGDNMLFQVTMGSSSSATVTVKTNTITV